MLWQRVVADRVKEQFLALMECQVRLPDYAENLLCEAILNDRLSVHIAQTILSAYLSEGWDRAIYLLEVWFEVQEIPDVEKYELNDTAQLLWRQQQEYCERNNISHTPAVIINGHYMPSVYQLEELKYLLVSSDNR